MDKSKEVEPPPYSQFEESNEDVFLTRMTEHLSRNNMQSPTPAQEREVARVKNFMTYMLSMDYQCNTKALLSAADREHFTLMYHQLRDLQRAHTGVTPTTAQRQTLGSYFWHHLHDPCKALHLPVECVLNAMENLTKFTDFRGWYKGSCFAVLQTHGIAALAEKLYMDKTLVIPSVIDGSGFRLLYFRCLDEIREFYFLSIDGVEASATSSETGRRKWIPIQNITYELNDRGRSYANQRKCAIGDAARGIEFSLLHWKAKAGNCIAAMKRRYQEIITGKRSRDPLMGWQGDGDHIDLSDPVPNSLWQWPLDWCYYPGWHLPDYFENRSRTRYTDA